jgi:dihydroorotase
MDYYKMKLLIKQAKIICSNTTLHGEIKDIFIEDGVITNISDYLDVQADKVISSENLHVSMGWMDVFAQFSDPGYEYRETLESGVAAAAAGGFTNVMIAPNTNPTLSSKTQIEYIVQKGSPLAVTIHPIGSITKNADGKELSEMYDMLQSGAIAFSDGTNPVQHAGIMIKALQYVLANQSVIIQIPDDKSIAANGLINEGIISTQLGLPGKPTIAEELMISRDIELAKYTNSKLHITGVSTRRSIEIINEAQQLGVNVTASATPYHAYFCDEDLIDYDTNLKVNPPLRTQHDMLAVREAIAEGVINCIASHHTPLHSDEKNCEFEYAKFGMIGLENVFGVLNGFSKNIDTLINQLTTNPRNIFGLTIPKIAEGEMACLTVFDPTIEYTFEQSNIKSTSANNPFLGKKLTGKVLGIINNNKTIFN